jgi:signal transduction histidine kinase/ligand-binding sensor domain-containing protein
MPRTTSSIQTIRVRGTLGTYRILASALLLSWSPTAWPLNPHTRLSDLAHTSWTAKDGAPPGGIGIIAQTSDGFLWMANGRDSGLYRFDGRRFEHIELPRNDRLSSMLVYLLYAPESGGLWIGFTFGGAAFLKDGHLTVYTEKDGLPPGSIKGFAQSPDGTLWVATTGGLAHLGSSGWLRLATVGKTAINPNELIADTQGTLWIPSGGKIYFLRKGENEIHELPGSHDDYAVSESASGVIWIARGEEGIRPIRQIENPGGRAVYSPIRMPIDRDGGIWCLCGSPHGLRRVAQPAALPANKALPWTESYGAKDGLTSDSLTNTALVDREGNVWVGTNRGLDRFSDRNVMHEFDVQKAGTGIAAASGGGLWVASREWAPISNFEGGIWHSQAPARLVSSLVRSDDGSTWFGGAGGLWRFANGWSDRIALPKSADGFEVQAMAQDRSGALWVSIVRRGVFRLKDGAWTPNGNLPTLPKLTAVTLSADGRGRIWLGYTENRIAVADGTHVQLFSSKQGLQIGNVTAIYGQRSRLWAGGEYGLAVLDGEQFQTVVPEWPLRLEGITGIVETEDGDLWLNSSNGIVHFTSAELRHVTGQPPARVHGEVFDAQDGVEGLGEPLRPHPTLIEGTDGKLWVATDVAVYSIDPAHLIRNSVPPPVVITSLKVGEQSFAPVDGLRLPKHSTALRIDYEGLSLTMPQKVRYRYKLDGVDHDWQDVQERDEAYYVNIAPGNYRFHVIASNNDGVWNTNGATISFVIPSAFTQTSWFMILCAALASALVVLVFKLRMHQIAAKMRLCLNERLRERERIARELHDTLLQSTQGLMLRVQVAKNHMPKGEPSREMLDRALKRADEVLAEARDRVQDLRVPQEARRDLAQSLAAVGDELALGRSVTFRMAVQGQTRQIRPKIVDEAYCIGREALLNAFHHAKASSIQILIAYGTTDMTICVRDDGCGIDHEILDKGSRAGHWGLKGMRERAREIGARIDIRSTIGSGTDIELTVPFAFAHRTPTWLRWFPFCASTTE